MKNHSVSAIIITLNEESNIRECLESVKWADEIVVVDSESTDRTVEIAKEYTDKVFVRPFPGNIEQNNYAISKTSGDWIFSIDADERVSEEAKQAIIRELSKPRADGYRFPRKNYFLGKWLRFGGWYPDHVLRLFRKDRAAFGGINPHGRVIVDTGNITTLKSDLIHYTYTNIAQYIDKQNSYSSTTAKEKFRRNRGRGVNPLTILLRSMWKFLHVYLLRLGFLDGFRGLVVAIGATYATFSKYTKIWELKLPK